MSKATHCSIWKLNTTPAAYRRWERVRGAGHVELLHQPHPLHSTLEAYAKENNLMAGHYLIVPNDDDPLHVAVEAKLVPGGLVLEEV